MVTWARIAVATQMKPLAKHERLLRKKVNGNSWTTSLRTRLTAPHRPVVPQTAHRRARAGPRRAAVVAPRPARRSSGCRGGSPGPRPTPGRPAPRTRSAAGKWPGRPPGDRIPGADRPRKGRHVGPRSGPETQIRSQPATHHRGIFPAPQRVGCPPLTVAGWPHPNPGMEEPKVVPPTSPSNGEVKRTTWKLLVNERTSKPIRSSRFGRLRFQPDGRLRRRRRCRPANRPEDPQ